MKKLTVLLALVIAFALAGCAAQGIQISPIGFDAAKIAALEAAGVLTEDAVFGESELKERNGQQYYEVDFRANGNEYEYDIDALTGAVISSETDVKAAKSKDATQPEKQDGKKQEEPKQEKADNTQQTKASEATKQPELIGEEKAKAAALAHAGLKADNVKFIRTELDRDDGRTLYEVDFYSGSTEYDYDIDAYSGAVIKAEKDVENVVVPQSQPQTASAPTPEPEAAKQPAQTAVSEADAKKIALAQVPGAAEADIREFEVDRDDGRVEYEGKIHYDGIEYEFEIDGHSGAIRSWEAEPVGYDD